MVSAFIALYKWCAIFFFIVGVYYWFKPEAKVISIISIVLTLMFSLFYSVAVRLRRRIAMHLSRCTGFNP